VGGGGGIGGEGVSSGGGGTGGGGTSAWTVRAHRPLWTIGDAAIAAHPTQPNTLAVLPPIDWVMTFFEVHRTSDGGSSFTGSTITTFNGGLGFTAYPKGLLFDPNSTAEVHSFALGSALAELRVSPTDQLAACALAYANDALHCTADGTSWQDITPPALDPPNATTVIAFTLAADSAVWAIAHPGLIRHPAL